MLNLNYHARPPDQLPELSASGLQKLRSAAADEVLECTREHLEALPGRSFYQDSASSLERASTAKQEHVGITKRGFALQYFGGTVKAGKGVSSKTGKKTKYLSIPANRGLTEMPSAYADLTFIKLKGDRGALVRLKEDKKSFTPMFWLVKQATIKPHPDILPDQSELELAASLGARDHLAALNFYQSNIA